MSRQDRRPQYRPRDEEHRGRFGFEYIKANINYKTEIPPLPEKPRAKPDEKARDKKVEQIQSKITAAKEARRAKKEEIKVVGQSYDQRILEVKRKIELGRKCIDVLFNDLDFIGYDIDKVNAKIRNRRERLDDNSAAIGKLRDQGKGQKKKGGRKLEELTLRELEDERRRIENAMSTRDLSKAEETELNAQLIKIGRLKADPSHLPQEQPLTDNSAAITAAEAQRDALRSELDRLRAEKSKYLLEKEDIDWKIHCIREDVSHFIAQIKLIAAQEESNQQISALYKEKDALKQQIYDLRQEVAAVEKAFDEKNQEYEYEQEKIKWIAWATKVQEEKREQWEAEKAERKRQKLREKQKGEKAKEGDKGKEGEKTEGEAKEKEKEERRRPNRNQKEIDNCSFLIDYCRRLYPSNNTNVSQTQKREVNLQAELKKGQWAKEKGVQIIQSKKNRKDDEEEQSVRPKKQQNDKQEESQGPAKFTHEYFVQKMFDNAKIIPPSSAEELDKIIKDLEDKVEYYLLHPDEGVDSKFDQDRRYVDKNTRNDKEKEPKYTKSKGSSKVINTEDFPSLQ